MVEPSRIAADLHRLTTAKHFVDAPVGSLVRISNPEDVGKILFSRRSKRVWRKTMDGWKFEGEKVGL